MSRRLLTASLALLLSVPALAATLDGVSLPDSVSVAGQSLVLNGMGLREKYFIDIYVAGLYLPAKTTDATAAIQPDVPKQLTMQFTYALSQEKLAETMKESITASGDAAAIKHMDTIAGWMEAMEVGDQLVMVYQPGKGTSIVVKGALKGTLPGADVMRALWGIYLGPKPPTTALRDGLLGN